MEREHTREDAVAAVRRMQDWIQTHLREPITQADLARAAGYSAWHAQRMFRELAGKAPFEYIRLCRLSQAALELRDGHERVIDVALDFVFDSHEGFTRSFSREFGVSPREYRQKPRPIGLFLPNPVLPAKPIRTGDTIMDQNQMQDQTGKGGAAMEAVFVQVIERPARQVLLRRGKAAAEYFAYCEEVGCDVWGVLCSVKEALYEPVGLWLPPALRPEGTSEYVQGVELPLDWAGPVPAGYELVRFEPASYMVFQGEPYDDDADWQGAIARVMQKIETFKPGIYGYEWAAATAPRFQLAPQGYRGYIEARPVRKAGR